MGAGEIQKLVVQGKILWKKKLMHAVKPLKIFLYWRKRFHAWEMLTTNKFIRLENSTLLP